MLTESELRSLLKSSEGQFLERKQSFQRDECQRTIVAFANSLPSNQHGVLFFGVADNGSLVGVDNADKTQKTISRIAQDDCFPPISCTPTAFAENGANIVAVVVEASPARPHFAGHSYTRIGSETKKASPQALDEMIAARNEKARRILRDKNQLVTTVWRNPERNHMRTATESRLAALILSAHSEKECRVESCDAHCVRLYETTTQSYLSASLERIQIEYDDKRQRTKLIIDNR